MEVIFPGKIQAYPKFLRVVRNLREIPEIEELFKQPKIQELCFLPQEMCNKGKMGAGGGGGESGGTGGEGV